MKELTLRDNNPTETAVSYRTATPSGCCLAKSTLSRSISLAVCVAITMQAVMGQPIKKIFFFELSRIPLSDQPLAKEPEDSVVMSLRLPISYPEFSGLLVSGWAPGETLWCWNFITAGFLQ